jgi:hypothetical protein
MNKAFYIKSINEDWELCMVYGYVGDNKYCIFKRYKPDNSITEDIGVFDSKEAIKVWESYEYK